MAELEPIRHSLAHLLAAAVLEHDPKAQLGIGPTVENGFYYDIKLSRPLSPEDLPELEEKMRMLAADHVPFERIETTAQDARERFKDQPFKRELIDDLEREGKKIRLYKSGDFIDLCRGGHVENTSEIPEDAFKLTKLAGAYWRGDETKPQLTRIYGIAFHTRKELEAYEAMLEEAEKRDHKKLGPALDLFVFSELVGPGLPLFTPKGTLVRNLLDEFVWELRRPHGYQKVEIPHITKKELYETSGHWEKFKDELFRIKTREGHEFAMKPMNCPHHTQIYDRRQWSYRDLPQRYANTTTCYRDEQTGELSGLSRVRAFWQDDAHVFCRMDQVKDEFLKVWDIVHAFYPAFGFELQVRLSTHDPAHMDNYLGTPDTWRKAEDVLREIVAEKGIEAIDGTGEAAFYGPKLDFMAHDSIGRRWQVATIQLDFVQPERFDLTCINEKGEKERIVMIHCAIMGSLERFLSILIEHTAGAFPTWLSPVQVKVLPISEKHVEYAREVAEALRAADIRAELDASDESLGKKIRNAKVEKVPYFAVIGDAEIEGKTVTLESRDRGKVGALSLEDLALRLTTEIRTRALISS